MRTTISLDDDAMEAIRAYAGESRVPLGKAASELIRRGAKYQLSTGQRNGLPVFQVPDGFPVLTTERVKELLDEE